MTPFERRIAVVGVVLGTASVGIATLEYSKSGPPAGSAPAEPARVVVEVEPKAPAPVANLPRVLVRRTLGGQLQYFESITGPPREIVGNTRYYSVDDCDLAIRVGADQSISSIAVPVSRACTFQWRDFMPNLTGLGAPEETTIAQFLRAAMPWTINRVGGCLSSCGNAADPEIWLYRTGSHADEWINVRVSYSNNTPREIEATHRFSQMVERDISTDATYDLAQTCDRRMIGWMDSIIGALTIEEVEFTFDRRADDDSTCDLTILQ